MKILVFGKKGQVAWELQRSLAVLGEIRVVGSDEASFLAPDDVAKVIREYKPTHIVNAAAYTAVDKAESEEEIAIQINGKAVGIIAEVAKKLNASLLHYSTDYVFDGSKSTPYIETDTPNPLNAYGRSKLLGERLIQEVGGNYIILRVSWVYGSRGNNFYKTMLRLGSEREELKIVADQVGAPTWSRHIADASSHIIRDSSLINKSGIYHLSPRGETSWFGFANRIFESYRSSNSNLLKVKSVLQIGTSDYPTPAKRPLNSRMNADKVKCTFGINLPTWEESLELVMSADRVV